MTEETPTVLVVEDDAALADLYVAWLDGECDVRVAHDGREALAAVEGASVVLLDRGLPDMTGDEVLARIDERDLDVPVAMVTGTEIERDAVVSAPHEHVTKPVSPERLRRTVSILLARRDYLRGVRELFALAMRKATLETERGPDAADADEERRTLDERLAERGERLDETLDSLVRQSSVPEAYRALSRGFDDDPYERTV